MNVFRVFFIATVCCGLVLTQIACGQEEDSEVSLSRQLAHSHLSGRLVVSTEIDTTQDYSGFGVLVAVEREGEPDTLGYGVTDRNGDFALDITAPARGVYAIVISRSGQILKIGEIAVAEGDSARLEATFPVGQQLLRLRSPENGAWAAYQNTKAQHNNRLLELLQAGTYTEETARDQILQSSMILWGMQGTFANTMGSEAAATEAVIMAAGWHDSLAVAWALDIPPRYINYAEVGRIARQAQARLAGQEAALAMVREFQERAIDDDQRAQLQSELVLARLDSLEQEEALQEASSMAETYAGTPWGQWAERAIYEIEHLLPGMDAPAFAVRTATGDSLTLEILRGRHVILEFYRPQDATYQRELEGRNLLLEEIGQKALTILSLSLEPDSLLNDAFLDGRDIPGHHVFLTQDDLLRRYNVNVLPTRYLLDPEGKIVAKYIGGAMAALREAVLARLPQDVE